MRKEIVDKGILVTSRNGDRKVKPVSYLMYGLFVSEMVISQLD